MSSAGLSAVILLSLLSPASAKVRESRVAHAPVTVYLRFENPPPAGMVEGLSAELETLMAPAGIRLDCRLLDDSRGEVSAELVVVSLKGSWQTSKPVRRNKSDPLGWTHISDGDILPFCTVDCDRIRDFIDPCLRDEPAPCKHLFCRAIARVLAHELYHIFADTTEHGIRGIAKGAFTAAELVFGDLYFSPGEGAALRDRKLRRLFLPTGNPIVVNSNSRGKTTENESTHTAAGGQ
jgi:hypothetical protein